MKPTTKQQAIIQHESKYYPGGKCPNGHDMGEAGQGRYLFGGACIACAKDRVKADRKSIRERMKAALGGKP